MKTLYKYILLYLTFVILVISLYLMIDSMRNKNIEFQKQILIKEARTHFNSQENTREWNSRYGGVYVKPIDSQKPNPYLQDNTLRVDENLTLIKINPAWMTRQLSELSNIKNFHFRITSLIPINPNNIATPFEVKALKYIEQTQEEEYYEFSNDKNFNYMGALITKKSCLPCHEHQGYTLGDVRGGISISLDTKEYNIVTSSITERSLILKIFTLLFLLSIALLIHKQIHDNERLQRKVRNRTKEIESTKLLLQGILDGDLSFLIVSNDREIIFANKAVLNFFNLDFVEDFKSIYPNISDIFEITNNKKFLQKYIDGEHWTQYLKREQEHREVNVIMKNNEIDRYFKAHIKEIIIDDEILYLSIFDEVTKVFQEIQELKESASIDALTQLFNRGKFDDVLSKEIDLCRTTNYPLSIIFLDIDHFKMTNDTYGHDAGDKILIGLSKLLTSILRKGDYLFRWGGEEFAITLSTANKFQASILAEKIRKTVEEFTFYENLKITISLGVTQYTNYESENVFIKRVDTALYEAKDTGRNKVIVK